LIFDVWVSHVVEQFSIENRPGAIIGLATRGLNMKTEKKAITPLILGRFW
jgi:hypothetical protein